MRFLHIAAASLALAGAGAHAQTVPVNDSWANRIPITSLPFADAQFILEATADATDPALACAGSIRPAGHPSIWYSFTTGASTEYLTLASLYDSLFRGARNMAIAVYRGTPQTGFVLEPGACNVDGQFPPATPRINGLRLVPSTEYSILVTAVDEPSTIYPTPIEISRSTIVHVTTTADTPPNGCTANDCTLREAVGAAGAEAVLVPAGTYTLSRPGANEDANLTGDLDITTARGIYGAGTAATVIDGADLDRVVHASVSRGTVIIGELTLRNGTVAGDGGAILASTAFLGLARVALLDNIASGNGGGLRATKAHVVESTLARNSALEGGGFDTSNVTVLRGTLLADNVASSYGGGGSSSRATVVVNSTISGNRAGPGGGGLQLTAFEEVAIDQSTIVGNSSAQGGGLQFSFYAPVSIRASILAGNAGGDCDISFGSLPSTAYNLVEQPAGCFGATASDGNVYGLDPALLPLADNGGPTFTHAIGPGPARDTGDPAGCTDAFGVTHTTDQRGAGFARVFNGTCDKGAYEAQPVAAAVPSTPDLVATSDSGVDSNDDITNDTTPTLSGTCQGGDTIELLDGAQLLSPSAHCTSGRYTITLATLGTEGLLTLTSRATRDTVATNPTSLSLVLDTTVAAPVIDLRTGPATQPTFAGTGEPFAALLVASSSSSSGCTTTVDATGSWSCTVAGGLQPGANEFTATQTDRAGNLSAPSASAVVTLATVPSIPDLVAASDSGVDDADDLTNDTTPMLTGTCQDGDVIELLNDAQVLAPAVTCAGGAYAITLAALAGDGSFALTARATRETVETSGALSLVLDTTIAPPGVDAPTGSATQPTLGGTGEPFAAVAATGSSTGCTATADASGDWSCTLAAPLAPGTHEFVVTQTDRAGNTSAESVVVVEFGDALFGNDFE